MNSEWIFDVSYHISPSHRRRRRAAVKTQINFIFNKGFTMAYFLKVLSRTGRLAPSYAPARASSSSSLVYSEEVLQAKMEDKPVVALESTIITHGMPYPQNLETALQVEHIVRQQGAIPATVAILGGQLTVGLTENQIKYLSQAKGVVKASRRDLAPVMANRQDGATTVAGTLIAAGLADIPIFVTGGIGGVHREGENTMDISADLTELGRTNTMVVCSGVKSILDIGRTLEYLETQGVCVCSFGESTEFPAFYTVRSGHRAPHHVEDAQTAARLLYASHAMRLGTGVVVAVPLPKEHAMDENKIEGAIAEALKVANSKGVKGKEVTPFILAAVARATGGASLAANIALIKNNAKVGADIAVEFKKLRNAENSSNIGASKGANVLEGFGTFKRQLHTSSRTLFPTSSAEEGDPLFGAHRISDGEVLVIGGANVDRTYRATEDQIQLDGSTHACKTRVSAGGVGRNLAEALWRLRGGRARLLTAVGDDVDGQYLAEVAPGLILDGCIIPGARTATYAAVLDCNGECRIGLGDMDIHNHISPQLVDSHINILEKAPMVVLDGNIPQQTVDHVIQLCHNLNKPVVFEPTDRRKAIKVLYKKGRLTLASPNLAELQAMAYHSDPNLHLAPDTTDLEKHLKFSEILIKYVDFLLVTLGQKGVLTVRRGKEKSKLNKYTNFTAKLYPVEVVKNVQNVSGAGDCFLSGFIHGVLSGFNESQCVALGFDAAKCALLADDTVPNCFNIPSSIKQANYENLV